MDNLELTKSINDIKVAEDGQIVAYLTTFENTDVVGDVIKTGALDKYVEDFNKGQTGILRMLFQHDRSEIIGKWDSLEIDEKGVIGTGTIFEEVSRGKDVKSLLMRGVLNSVSIGFRATDYVENDKGGRDFKEIELVETSVVDIPANPQATILSVKAEDGAVNIRMLEKILRDAGLSIKESKTVASVAKEELSVVRDEQEVESDLLKALQNFNLHK
jgi:HK97 family phage prohead protease